MAFCQHPVLEWFVELHMSSLGYSLSALRTKGQKMEAIQPVVYQMSFLYQADPL